MRGILREIFPERFPLPTRPGGTLVPPAAFTRGGTPPPPAPAPQGEEWSAVESRKGKGKRKQKKGEDINTLVPPPGGIIPPANPPKPRNITSSRGPPTVASSSGAPAAASYAAAAAMPERRAKTAAREGIRREISGSSPKGGARRSPRILPVRGGSQGDATLRLNKKKRARGGAGAKKAPAPPQAQRLPRTPRTAAVTITCPKGKYGEVVAATLAKVGGAEDLGLPALRPRRTQTGNLLLEVKGPDGVVKANALAARLGEATAGMEGVRIGRPTRTVDLRVRDLVDSVGGEEVVAALAEAGGCCPSEISLGRVGSGGNGLGTTIARCPTAAAKRAVARGRIRVSLFEARVDILPARPVQCYRCHQRGHVRQQCRAEQDSSEDCFRCGAPGHQARDCRAPAHCPACAKAGLPA